ncbi:hypothetical protein PHMEG_0009630 [Phytophthora megakarya]|uniref:Uncharacterized protein n=1 Tax=Phytophthora megakarya TaxID=4795 RepID=A0A225WH42_9STRA|nr:hypothetical protein PHMEG_0009630 [Phytophthora megakarya]
MCFACPDVSSPSICLMAAWLSTCNLYGIFTLSSISLSNSTTPNISAVTSDAATNSASIVDKATLLCFLQIQPTTMPQTISAPPFTDLRSTRSPAKSASLYPSITMVSLLTLPLGACTANLVSPSDSGQSS